jgi:two-component system chemotaxis sensor kinase CheA
MVDKDHELLQRLLATFRIEAQERLNTVSSGIVELEHAASAERQLELCERLFREIHSLKGAARAVNMTAVEAICQALESVFATLKRGDMPLSPRLFDVLHQTMDGLGSLLFATGMEHTAGAPSQLEALHRLLEQTAPGIPAPAGQEPLDVLAEVSAVIRQPAGHRLVAGERLGMAETVRISTAKLDAVFLRVEELLSTKLVARQRAAELREIAAALTAWKKARTNIDAEVRFMQQACGCPAESQAKRRLQTAKVLEFLEWETAFCRTLESSLAALTTSAEHDQRALSRMVDDLVADMKQVLMLPFMSLVESLPKVVRDLAHAQGKQVELVIHGAEIAIDRRLLEALKDPLLHLLRNCVDHGIEPPEVRARKGKPRRGTVTVAIAQTAANKVEIVIADDGAGIDMAAVRAAASKLGLLASGAAEGKASELVSLIFESGVSTSPIVTDISGRGLGLAIVREKVEDLGGAIGVDTQPDVGTAFRLALPLTLATFRGVVVRVSDQLFVVPTTHVERVARLRQEALHTVANRETIQLQGQAVSLVQLADVLELPRKPAARAGSDKPHVVVLSAAERRMAFVVDEVLDEQEVLVKHLGKQLSRVRNIAGATLLANGKVVPIINVPDALKSAARLALATPPGPATPRLDGAAVPRKSILVVEDSITARTLLKQILETAGYDVKTAVDGVDALARLRAETFDLVISDVDMPRLNGFDLTAQIRSHPRLAQLPVVLVTALESRDDRERGIDVGANAYVVKSGFDQSHLLAAVDRLV